MWYFRGQTKEKLCANARNRGQLRLFSQNETTVGHAKCTVKHDRIRDKSPSLLLTLLLTY